MLCKEKIKEIWKILLENSKTIFINIKGINIIKISKNLLKKANFHKLFKI